MIITRIRLQEEHPMSAGSISWPLAFCDFNLDSTAGENGYLIKAGTGLGPPDIIAIVEGFDSNGVPILGPGAENREITFRIELKPGLNQSYSSLRDDLYRFMGKGLLISLMDESLTNAVMTGYITKFETVHFSNKPEVQITIKCNDPELYSPFTVPIPSSVLAVASPVISYDEGTAPTGLDIQFTVSSNHSNFSITGHSKMWHAGAGDITTDFTVTYAFLTGDVVTLSTYPKRLTLLRSSVTYDLAGYINSGAVWPKLYSGVNAFNWTLATSWLAFNSASYTPRYWGV